MKHLLLTTLLTLLAAGAFAQKGNVTATIVDAETGNSVVGAVLTVAPTKAPEKKQGFASGYKGVASIPSLAYGEYALTVSFIGYHNLDTTFRLSTSRLNLGTLKLKPGVQIETVVKEVKAMRVGGNDRMNEFFAKHNIDRHVAVSVKYKTETAALYRSMWV